ncbi:zona pellucida sperm-binding protein 1-like [Coregonus clupeaformis]|uniref:zona pellucida sperm-binding protein 1-like n=1 Tax=Coregonus clupeaformis TaxID=59861 RepID=UPI001BDFE843|nr:zona pellucida sperm-binding protein 1-like [Coregonus clupeaformis]
MKPSWFRMCLLQDEGGYLVYEKQMSSSYEVWIGPLASITRDSHFQLLFQCRYLGSTVEALVVDVNSSSILPCGCPRSSSSRAQTGKWPMSRKDCNEGVEACKSYYTAADYPVTKVLREPVYTEVHILGRTDPKLVLILVGDVNSQP